MSRRTPIFAVLRLARMPDGRTGYSVRLVVRRLGHIYYETPLFDSVLGAVVCARSKLARDPSIEDTTRNAFDGWNNKEQKP